jgi:hypothetical protein
VRLRRLCLVSLSTCVLVLTGCGHPKSFNEVQVQQPRGPKQMQQSVNALSAADEGIALRHRDEIAFIEAVAWNHAVQPLPSITDPPVVLLPDAPVQATVSSPWDCIAAAETGADYTMHGATYSTAFGVINDIVYQYGTPDEQRQIFSGTASKETQIAVVSRFTAQHGFGGWGVLTKQKCGLG